MQRQGDSYKYEYRSPSKIASLTTCAKTGEVVEQN
jgi:hypothetical protein